MRSPKELLENWDGDFVSSSGCDCLHTDVCDTGLCCGYSDSAISDSSILCTHVGGNVVGTFWFCFHVVDRDNSRGHVHRPCQQVVGECEHGRELKTAVLSNLISHALTARCEGVCVADAEDRGIKTDHCARSYPEEGCVARGCGGAPRHLHHLEESCDILDCLDTHVPMAGFR